jgi:hypothetical protein
VAQSLVKNLVHLVFSTRNREPPLAETIRAPLCAYAAAVLRDLGSPVLASDAWRDHVGPLSSHPLMASKGGLSETRHLRENRLMSRLISDGTIRQGSDRPVLFCWWRVLLRGVRAILPTIASGYIAWLLALLVCVVTLGHLNKLEAQSAFSWWRSLNGRGELLRVAQYQNQPAKVGRVFGRAREYVKVLDTSPQINELSITLSINDVLGAQSRHLWARFRLSFPTGDQ